MTNGEKVETVTDFFSWAPKSPFGHKIKRYLLLGRKAMTNLDSILKSRDNTWPSKVYIAKAMVFQQSYSDIRAGT